ncbi:MAG: response regulator [Elusimicrobia bacterium]|nr:response regulator [Elusimicrobiota bacterium]
MTAPNQRRILLVDDDDAIQKLLVHVIGKEGFQVDAAADGEEALRKIGEVPPHLIVLDLMLPRYGGFEVLRHLQTSAHSGIPIVVITGRYTDKSTAELIRQESNVADFLEKPIKLQLLLAAIHRVLGTEPGEISAEANRPAP